MIIFFLFYRPVGMPKMEKVYLHNPSSEETITLVSISATTSHFHASFFQNRVSFSAIHDLSWVCSVRSVYQGLKLRCHPGWVLVQRLWGEVTSKLIKVVERIRFLVVVELKPLFGCWLLASDPSQQLRASGFLLTGHPSSSQQQGISPLALCTSLASSSASSEKTLL